MKKILVHNADDDFMDLITQTLYAKGYEAKSTKRREEVPVLLSDYQPDLFLLDMNQENVLGDLQGHKQMTNTPVLLMTSRQDNAPVRVWPVSGTIVKPFSVQDLSSAIDKLLDNK